MRSTRQEHPSPRFPRGRAKIPYVACAAAVLLDAACEGGGEVRASDLPANRPAVRSEPPPSRVAEAARAINACVSTDGAPATFPVQPIRAHRDPSEVLEAAGAQIVATYMKKGSAKLLEGVDAVGLLEPARGGLFAAREGDAEACARPVSADAVGLVRVAREPGGEVVVYVDVCGLAPARAESGFYETWMVHDLRVPPVAPAREDGSARPGTITPDDAEALAAMGDGHNVPGAVYTSDGTAPRDDDGANVLRLYMSLGAWNTSLAGDGHAQGILDAATSWSFPPYELAGTGGALDEYLDGRQYAPLGGLGPYADSRVPGTATFGKVNAGSREGKVRFGDDPRDPRDPDRSPATCPPRQREDDDIAREEAPGPETRLRGIPPGLAREVLWEAYVRPLSAGFDLGRDPGRRVLTAYAKVVAPLDADGDGVLSFDEASAAEVSAIDPTEYERVVVTRELNDGLLAPRLAPSRAAHVLEGPLRWR